jgi:UDP-N-acetylglucosamine 1-carboxyvinyltransferase
VELLRIKGGQPLQGRLPISGAKNSALALLVGAALGEEPVRLDGVPDDADVFVITDILKELGVGAQREQEGVWHIDGSTLNASRPSYELARKLRASFYVTGMLLARLHEAEVPLPGGCFLGPRPVDFHLKGFQSFGAEVGIEHGLMKGRIQEPHGTRFLINRSSMGTTINLLYLAALTPGMTILESAAKEPEVVDLAVLLNCMGAKIRGAGTDVIRVQGVPRLHGADYTIIPDRIEVGTYMMAVAATGGDVVLENVMPEHLRAPITKVIETGAVIEEGDSSIRIRMTDRPRSTDVETAPYPGFATDLQQPMGALLTIAHGTSVVRETIYENRFRYLEEIMRMGADVRFERDRAIINGVSCLTGAPVEVADLRAGAALVIAGLAAHGETVISGVELIDRGYERIETKLRNVGADITRETINNR